MSRKLSIAVPLALAALASAFAAARLAPAGDSPQERYIARYAATAVQEMYRSGVPASITLAQGLLESRYGMSELAVKGNNHFGIKCHDWKGRTMRVDDERKGECFRVYGDASESYADHSDFLRYRTRYRPLFDLEVTDYKGWAYGLSKAGYATDPQYASKLIRIIEDYGLSRFDAVTDPAQMPEERGEAYSDAPAAPGKAVKPGKGGKAERKLARESRRARRSARRHPQIPDPPSALDRPEMVPRATADEEFRFPLTRKVYRQNGVPFVYSEEGETYASIAEGNGMFEDELLRCNDLKRPGPLPAGTAVFIRHKKARAAKGLDKYIVDHDGESLRDICQHYAVKMKSIAKLNDLKPGHVLREGDTILLR